MHKCKIGVCKRRKRIFTLFVILVVAFFTWENLVGNENLTKYLPYSLMDWREPFLISSVVPYDQRMLPENIRFAVFGTSIAWGAGLEKREQDAFIWRLSPHASNFGMRGTGAEYPAKCLSSMIGDQIFDVIVLEFTMRIDPSTYSLARRLRERFPDALIICLKNWTPVMIKSRKLKNRCVRTLANQYGFPPGYIHDPRFHKFIKKINVRDWQLDWGESQQFRKHIF